MNITPLFNEATRVGEYDEERIAIMFREGREPDWSQPEYIFNIEGDNWFRVSTTYKNPSAGTGLLFKDLKITSKKIYSRNFGQTGRALYKGSIQYVPSSHTTELDWADYYEKANIWFIIPEILEPDEAIKTFIKKQAKLSP